MADDILIIDDEPSVREMLSMVLRPLKTPIREAPGGPEALEMAAHDLPAVIILDLMMPGMDGSEVLRALKANPHTAPVPVLIYTAKQLSPELRAELEANSPAILHKGQDSVSHIRQTVTHAMSAHR